MNKTYEVREGVVYEVKEIVTPTQTAVQELAVGMEYHLSLSNEGNQLKAEYLNYLGERQNYNGPVTFSMDGEEVILDMVDGVAKIDFTVEVPGQYRITASADHAFGEVVINA